MAGPVVSGVVVEVVVVAAVVGDVEGDVVGVGGTEVETGPSAGSDAGTVDGGASEVDVDASSRGSVVLSGAAAQAVTGNSSTDASATIHSVSTHTRWSSSISGCSRWRMSS